MQTTRNNPDKHATSPVDLTLAGYELLRLRPRQWRRLASQLAGPAVRLHRLRNARTRMWQEAICELDCTGRAPAGNSCND